MTHAMHVASTIMLNLPFILDCILSTDLMSTHMYQQSDLVTTRQGAQNYYYVQLTGALGVDEN